MSLDIVALGHIIHETIVFPDFTTKSVLGSPPAYSMVCAARLGAKVGLVTKIGSDYPKRLLCPFYEAKVDTEGIRCSGDVSTTTQLVYARDGSKVIHYLKKAPKIAFEDVPQSYHDARLFYVCPMDFEAPFETVQQLRGLGGLLAADVGGFGGAHVVPQPAPQMEKDPEGTQRLFRTFDIIKASDEDCRRLTGDVHVDVHSLGRQFLSWGVKIVVITKGSRGALVITRDSERLIPAFPGKPIDVTGGGDTYMAGFLFRYLQTNDVFQAGLFGAVTALLVIEGTGGVSAARMPTFDMVEARLQKGRRQLGI
ncbi:MAG TPA: carbohydrate kinase family protein [Desulfobacterales bacterium]|nr:carbohydrate kinase family protein [Desulfobacterales bacterium]